MNEEPRIPEIDPQLEARVIALVLGEASDFEREELNRMISKRPELQDFREEMERVHGDLREVSRGEWGVVEDDWKLSPERRKVVEAAISGQPLQPPNPLTANITSRFVLRDKAGSLWPIAKIAAAVSLAGFFTMLSMMVVSYQSLESSRGALARSPASDMSTEGDAANLREFNLGRSARAAITIEASSDAKKPLTNFAEAKTSEHLWMLDNARIDRAQLEQKWRSFVVPSGEADGKESANSPEGEVEIDLEIPAASNGAGYTVEGRRDHRDSARAMLDSYSTMPGQMLDGGESSSEGQSANGVINDFTEPTLGKGLYGDQSMEDALRFAAPGSGIEQRGQGQGDSGQPRSPQAGEEIVEFSDEQFMMADDMSMMGMDAEMDRFDDLAAGGGLGGGAGEIAGLGTTGAADPTSGGFAGRASEANQSGDTRFRSVLPSPATPPSLPARQPGLPDQTSSPSSAGSLAEGVKAKAFFENGGSLDDGIPSRDFDPAGMLDAKNRDSSFQAMEAGQDQNIELGGLAWQDNGKTYDKRVMDSAEKSEVSGDFYNQAIPSFRSGDSISNGISGSQPEMEAQVSDLFERTEAGGAVSFDTTPSLLGVERKSLERAPARRIAAPPGLNETSAQDEAFSTFSLHVSDVSFKLAGSALARGEWPDASEIRVEEFVNAFDYGDPMPSDGEKVACRVEQCIHPFLQQRNLLRIALRTAAAGRASTTPLRLTFVVDNSGSMERIDRQQTLRLAFTLLAQQLQPTDQVTLISFARQARLLADKVSGSQSDQLVQLIDNLPSEGGTNVESALQLAFEKAREQQVDNAQNRIVLLTDGAVNLGDADPDNLSRIVLSMRDAGIAFDAAGISAEGLNDEILEALTRQGDGRYYLLDSADDADEDFVRQIAGALRPSAKNVKVQVEFNPKRVGRYKLLGFEKHLLNREDFRNDKVDAAEMAAAEAGVAVYQFEAKPDGEGDVGSVSVRFRDLSTGQMVENRWPIPYEANAPLPNRSSPSLRIATTAALLAARLREDPLGQAVDLKTLSSLVVGLPDRYRSATRVQQLQTMIQQTRQLSGN